MATKTGLTAEDIKCDQLYGVLLKARGESQPYLDAEIESKIRAAEDFYSRDLHILWGRHKVISAATERGITVNPDATPPEIEEPAYDYHRDFFQLDRWGHIFTRHRPILPDPNSTSGITRWVFAFPSASQVLFEVPQDWIKPDFQFGQLNLIPATGAIFASFNVFILSVVSGGAYGLPKVIYIDYDAGIDTTRLDKDHADLKEGVKLRTFLLMGGILSNLRAEGLTSGSLGIDGLSHSRSFGKYGAYSGALEWAMEREKEIRKAWYGQTMGPIFTVV